MKDVVMISIVKLTFGVLALCFSGLTVKSAGDLTLPLAPNLLLFAFIGALLCLVIAGRRAAEGAD
ncbi:hypothetical protein B5C34_13370 [Pacificimonas flava]|uniref:Uncharacterized protein n=2 Tax=Pacificimonas TaxID=1960290 RepID=A0A219B956_9SPHN|nr:hypothetical protein B5C34_13370 [Pacificimonas flava]